MEGAPTQKIIDGYLAIVLDEDSQKALLQRFPPLYPKVFAHHVTVAFKPTTEVYDQFKKYLGAPIALTVYGYAKDEKAETILVAIDILKDRQNHITISTNGVAPIYSKALIEKGYTTLEETLSLKGTFEFIAHQPR